MAKGSKKKKVNTGSNANAAAAASPSGEVVADHSSSPAIDTESDIAAVADADGSPALEDALNCSAAEDGQGQEGVQKEDTVEINLDDDVVPSISSTAASTKDSAVAHIEEQEADGDIGGRARTGDKVVQAPKEEDDVSTLEFTKLVLQPTMEEEDSPAFDEDVDPEEPPSEDAWSSKSKQSSPTTTAPCVMASVPLKEDEEQGDDLFDISLGPPSARALSLPATAMVEEVEPSSSSPVIENSSPTIVHVAAEDSVVVDAPPVSSETSASAEPPSLAADDSASLTPDPSSLSIDVEVPPASTDPSPAASSASPRKAGPSMMQKIISMTRQRDLPPKNRLEETRHLKELEEMRAASQGAEKRRKSQLDAAAVQRSATLASTLPTWEKFILPNWRAVLRSDEEGVSLRRLWRDGTMPVRFRGRLWGMTIGNQLAVNKTAFAACLAQANASIASGSFSEEMLQRIELDLSATMPRLRLFQSGGVMHEDLRNLLLAYCSFKDASNPRYPPGLCYPAAMLMINMTPAEAFLSLINLVDRSLLKSFYNEEDPSDIEAYSRIFDTLLADSMDKVYLNFTKEDVRPSTYLIPWISTCFIRYLPLDLATRVFDVFLLEGDSFLFKIALVLLEILEARLFNPVREELNDVFKGEDRGAVAIVKRSKDRDEAAEVEVEEVYATMGVSEEVIFTLLEKLDIEFKQDSWDRLVERELPESN